MMEQTRPHLLAVAEVLLDLSLDIEGLGTTLCADEDFVLRHVQKLQLIDLVAQKQRSLAVLLQADCAESAMAEICLDDLRERLRDLVDADDWQQI